MAVVVIVRVVVFIVVLCFAVVVGPRNLTLNFAPNRVTKGEILFLLLFFSLLLLMLLLLMLFVLLGQK